VCSSRMQEYIILYCNFFARDATKTCVFAAKSKINILRLHPSLATFFRKMLLYLEKLKLAMQKTFLLSYDKPSNGNLFL